MEVTPASIPDVLLIRPRVFEDDRGYFFESYNHREFEARTGVRADFVQDNQSRSRRNVLRGLHYQNPAPQGKLVRVLDGEIFDVVVDLRRRSPTFGQWHGVSLSSATRAMIWVPAGFAHGFLVLSEHADVFYKATDYYAPQHEHCMLWNDPRIGIRWPVTGEPEVSARDRQGKLLKDAAVFA